MNSTLIESAITELSGQIALRQDAIKALQALNGNVPRETISPRLPKVNHEAPPKARRGKLVRTETPARPSAPPNGERHKTVSGALKRHLHEIGLRTRGALRALGVEDADLVDLFQETAFKGALAYWVKTGKLKQAGEGDEAIYTVLDKTWFAPKET